MFFDDSVVSPADKRRSAAMSEGGLTTRSSHRIVIVGATNVGKSSLFNKLTRSRKAIVADRPGVTVDAHSLTLKDDRLGDVEIVDTGGVGMAIQDHPLQKEINAAAEDAVRRADVVLFVVDGTRDLTVDDFDVATWLRKQQSLQKPIWVLANKSDSKKFSSDDALGLGFEKVIPVSAEHGQGIDQLWNELSQLWRVEQIELEHKKAEVGSRIIVLGRPNTGKSTLLNALIGEEKHVTSPVAGTTRDPVESRLDTRGRSWLLCDTAGLRRPGRLERDVEWVAKEKLKDKLREADIALVVLDADQGVSDMDASIVGMAADFGVSVILVMNKWDLMQGEDKEDKLFTLDRESELKLRAFDWCPRVRISALHGKGLKSLMNWIHKVEDFRKLRVGTGELNRLFEKKIRHHVHPVVDGKSPKFYYLSQVKAAPPEFVIFSSLTGNQVHFSYRRFINNSLRQSFGFEGTPLKLHFKQTRA